jgi:hypothetical protein
LGEKIVVAPIRSTSQEILFHGTRNFLTAFTKANPYSSEIPETKSLLTNKIARVVKQFTFYGTQRFTNVFIKADLFPESNCRKHIVTQWKRELLLGYGTANNSSA